MPPKKKKIKAQVKLQVKAGQANPAPPVGPALGQHGVNIMDFCNQFNERTREQQGLVIPVVITIFDDRSRARFTTIFKNASMPCSDNLPLTCAKGPAS